MHLIHNALNTFCHQYFPKMYVFNDTPTHVYKHPNCYELQEAGNDQRRQRGIEEQQRR